MKRRPLRFEDDALDPTVRAAIEHADARVVRTELPASRQEILARLTAQHDTTDNSQETTRAAAGHVESARAAQHAADSTDRGWVQRRGSRGMAVVHRTSDSRGGPGASHDRPYGVAVTVTTLPRAAVLSAERSLHTAYIHRYGAWISHRRRTAALSALWWTPAIVAAGVILGATTHFAAFGLVFLLLAMWAALDVLFHRPDRLVRVRERAAAESGTGKVLRAVEIRGGARVLHDRLLTAVADPFEVEHLVISPRGVFLIDSKQWHGQAVRLVGADMYVNHATQEPMFKGLVEHARVLGGALTTAAARNEEVGVVSVTPVLAVHADDLHGTPRNMQGVVVVTPPQLPGTLRSPDVRWSPQAVASLIEAADLLLIRKDPSAAP